jgi:hypothetical protein
VVVEERGLHDLGGWLGFGDVMAAATTVGQLGVILIPRREGFRTPEAWRYPAPDDHNKGYEAARVALVCNCIIASPTSLGWRSRFSPAKTLHMNHILVSTDFDGMERWVMYIIKNCLLNTQT